MQSDNIKLLNNILTNHNNPVPFTYSITHNHNFDNIILIHDQINNYKEFALYANNKSLSIIYNSSSSSNELTELLTKYFKKIKRIAFVFHNANITNLKEFINNKPLFDFNDLETDVATYSDNLQFIIDLSNKFNVEHLDFLACNTLLYDHWNKYYNILKEKTNAIIGASNDLTGNIKYGADWTLENTNEDIKNIYFTNDVENYAYTLDATTISQAGGTITFSQADSISNIIGTYSNGTTVTLTSSSWPATINNTDSTNTTLTITFNTNLYLTNTYGNTNGYFILGSNNITINGNNKEVNINGISSYPGLFQNGTNSTTPSFTGITIENLGVTSTNSTLIQTTPYGGWVCQGYFGAYAISGNITVNYCYSNGNIGGEGGGIFGEATGQYSSATISAYNCYSLGSIIPYGGGIFGSYTGYSSSGTISAYNCYSFGSIGQNGGGIFGDSAGLSSSGTISAYNCYSLGSIGQSGGGIFGSYAGGSAQSTSPTSYAKINANNCYSIGNISTNAGGIFGQYAGNGAQQYVQISANNCYTIGQITTSGTGIYGGNNNGGTYQNCYFTNGVSNWNDSDANNNLIINTNVWVDINSNTTTPYLLSSFNQQIYSPNTVTINSSTYTSEPGLFTSSYLLISPNVPNITINQSTGVLTFSDLTSQTYTENVLSYLGTNPNYYSYNINNFILTVSIYPCFKEDTKILTNDGYRPIQYLRKGDLVKTFKHGFLPIVLIGKRYIYHQALQERIKDQLYKCSKDNFDEVFEPLIITGAHSILVDNFINEDQKRKMIEVNGDTYVTDNKYRLAACADPRALIYEIPGTYTIYHFALKNDNYYMNYGIYANGLLVETCSKRYLKELSNMTLIE